MSQREDSGETALAVRSLGDYLERVPDALVYGVRRPSGADR
jgi:hypothetical protein